MRTTLQTLWDWHQAENATNRSEKEKELSKLLLDSESTLFETLSEEQKESLEQYTECLQRISNLIEEEAFINGICFATAYLLDALYKK